MLDYRIVEKASFTIVGVKRPFHSDKRRLKGNERIYLDTAKEK